MASLPETSSSHSLEQLDFNPRQEQQQSKDEKAPPRPSALETGAGRLLVDQDKVFDHNAWDNVPWDEEQEQEALQVIEKQALQPVPDNLRDHYNTEAAGYWDKFYSLHTNQFFKDRHWLRVEFPELYEPAAFGTPDGGVRKAFEIGCGAGNTVFPLIDDVQNVFVYAADFSSTAISVVKANPDYNESRCKAFVYDITSPDTPPEIEPGTIDVCICIFVLSALKPTAWAQAGANIFKLLKPGGIVVFRDYGRYDMAQLRFKGGRMLDQNFYIRGDGTQDDVNTIFKDFEVIQNVVDRRLLVNRSRQLKMYRVWIQAKMRKPLEPNN
ncbi:hypothetical protein HDU76_004638 [Blyttiomyces sp. JEL0837]|nr:hypothetical protein HDU76_004638 [Blyttiomyces sp. JEL0837]